MTRGSDAIKFANLSGPSLDGDGTSDIMSMDKKKKGCHVSPRLGLGLAVLAVLLALGVGLIVHFASKKTNCNCGINPESDGQWEQCLEISAARNECLNVPQCQASPDEDVAPTAAPLPQDVRLPEDLIPLHYDLELWPDIYAEDPSTFHNTGNVSITIHCVNPTDVVIIHIKALNITEETISFRSATPGDSGPSITTWEEDKEREFFKVHLSAPLHKGHNYTLYLEFMGMIEDDLAGLYRSSYTLGNETKWLATTQFQPTDARKAFPCFDEPAIKATFTVTLKRRPHITSISNMPIISTENRPDGWVADNYQKTVKMSTYLLAFIFCEFEYREMNTSSGVRFRVWSRPDAIEQVQYALTTGVAILEHFEQYFAIDFPLPKQDMVAVPDFNAGAMENWGLIIYRETALLYQEGVSSEYNKQRVAVVVSHELAHQWFGNLVTPKWWDDLWLNEGFASYVEYLGVHHVHPDWKMMQQFLGEDLHYVFESDAFPSSHPIFVPVNHPDEINEIFDGISYSKGACVIKMMNKFLGEETFKKGLTKYLRRHAYGNAHNSDLWTALDEQAATDGNSEIDVAAVMDTWILQMGYPVVTLTRQNGSDTVHVTQDYFLLDPALNHSTKYKSPYGYKWMVPLTYTTNTDRNFDRTDITWMRKADATLYGLPTGFNWIIGNLYQNSYYRVNYDLSNWDSLIQQLNNEHGVIAVENRAQIIDDSFNLGRAGLLDMVVAMRATEYLGREDEFLVWDTAKSNLNYVNVMMQLSPSFGNFKRYMVSKVETLYGQLGWTVQENDGHIKQYKRELIVGLACKYENPECIATGRQRFQEWMENPADNRIPPGLRPVVYCLGVKHGGEAEWNFVYEQYKQANVAAEKSKLLYAMACTKVEWILKRYLERALNESIFRRQDKLYVLAYISRSPYGRHMTWDYFRQHFDYFLERWGKSFFALARLIRSISASFNTEFQLRQLEDFKKQQTNLGSVGRTLDQAIEKTKANIRWMEANERKIGDWLETQPTSNT